jgi:hypothetical protein
MTVECLTACQMVTLQRSLFPDFETQQLVPNSKPLHGILDHGNSSGVLADHEVPTERLDGGRDRVLAVENVLEINEALRALVRVTDPPLALGPHVGVLGAAIAAGPCRMEVVGHEAVNVRLATVATVGIAHLAVLLHVARIGGIVLVLAVAPGDGGGGSLERMLDADLGGERRDVSERDQRFPLLLIGGLDTVVVIEENPAVVVRVAIPVAVDAFEGSVPALNYDIASGTHDSLHVTSIVHQTTTSPENVKPFFSELFDVCLPAIRYSAYEQTYA